VERERKIRRLVDANIIGIFIRSIEAEVDGPIVEANDAFLRMVGYDREDLVSGRIRWAKLTPPEWQDRDAQAVAELKMSGTVQPFEKEYFRKDGSRIPVLIGAASLESDTYGVAFVLDLTERKRVEAEARDSERRYREAQTELAHASRIATMGQLTASIAHEVNQPIAGALSSGQAALRWLDKPDLEAARRAVERVITDIRRAGDVIRGLRALVTKAPPQAERFDVNEVIREVIEITRGEAVKNGVLIETRLAKDLPHIRGIRVQLQQVILNLVINGIEAMSGVAEGPREMLIETTRSASASVSVVVRDSGPGLDAAVADRLFEAFYTTKREGLGMGLSICRSIVETHGGKISVTANVPHGAIFQFTVPARETVYES
jgi:PAS domain S-box-containing protein